MLRSTLAALAGCFATAVVAQTGTRNPGLTAEQLRILSHMRLVEADDGHGNRLPTIRFEGVNVQIVNGKGATSDVNGLGNLIVGYQEVGWGHAVERTGSHNVIVGDDTNYASYACLSSGGGNRMLGPLGAAVGAFNSTVRGHSNAVVGGEAHEVDGFYNVLVGGAGHYVAPSFGQGNVVVGGSSARIEGEATGNVVVGGMLGSVEDGEYNAVVGGSVNQVTRSYFVATLGTQNARADSGEMCAMVGGVGNTIGLTGGNLWNAVVVGGQQNAVASQDHATVVGGQLNRATGKWSTVTGGFQRTAAGAHDWVGGGLFQDN